MNICNVISSCFRITAVFVELSHPYIGVLNTFVRFFLRCADSQEDGRDHDPGGQHVRLQGAREQVHRRFHRPGHHQGDQGHLPHAGKHFNNTPQMQFVLLFRRGFYYFLLKYHLCAILVCYSEQEKKGERGRGKIPDRKRTLWGRALS